MANVNKPQLIRKDNDYEEIKHNERSEKKGGGGRDYVSIGRMGIQNDDIAPVDRIKKPKDNRFSKFDASKGRDYSDEKSNIKSQQTIESEEDEPR